MSAAATTTTGAIAAERSSGATPRAFAGEPAPERSVLLAAPVRWPRPSRLQEPLKPTGKRAAAGLRSLRLGTRGELLEHLPSDSRRACAIAELQAGEQATVAVEVRSIAARPVRRRRMRPLVQARVADATGSMRATFFNQPWLAERYVPGTRLTLHGRADGKGGFTVSHHALGAEVAVGGEEGGAGGAVAHYPAADGISSTELLTLVTGARPLLHDFVEALPGRLRADERLPARAEALAAMHFARDEHDAPAGRRRLAFEELLLTQLEFMRRRAQRAARSCARPLNQPPSDSARWLRERLPFTPTADQLRAAAQIDDDLARPTPMQRLLMGDVGSGKTVVALYAMLRAVEHGRQAVLMAPTETLAEQHFATIQTLLGGEPVACALLTGSTPAARRRDVLGKLGSGELALLVGTHALIEPDVRFAALAVAVIDEQHRFGVRQRAALEGKDPEHPPHALHMTATPIPRTLALARYGDLDTSTLRERPQGRRPIETRLLGGPDQRAQAYEELRAELAAGRQAYVVCPLIEAQDAGDQEPPEDVRAARSELDRLAAGELAGFELVLLHGAMRPREKQEAMRAFASGAAQVLVATTVIEVGIDVPNATVMLIENAERFGISQLHQLRGRVGRGEHPGRCLLAGPADGAVSRRLRALVDHDDGFRLAEIDLELRKEGELIGTRQSGMRAFRVARLPEDAELLERARVHAEAIFANDPGLERAEHALLADELGALDGRAEEGAVVPLPA